METRLSFKDVEVTIGSERPTVLIGERINPTGRKALSKALHAGDFNLVRAEARAQVEAGADVLDVNVGAADVDEAEMLPEAVRAVTETVSVPLCIDSNNPKALEAALKDYQGKPVVNSVTGEERSLAEVLPLIKEFGAVVIGLTMDDDGIPNDSGRRLEIAAKILDRAVSLGIPREDVIIDCLAMAIGADGRAGLVTLETIERVRAELGLNTTLGASNISFGMPDRTLLNNTFLAATIKVGLTCAIVNVSTSRAVVTATDLIMGRDRYARRYITAFRQRQ
jgi:5-methyltetrahydrofolate--homocysteine methyltransferase